MKRKFISIVMAVVLVSTMITGCSKTSETSSTPTSAPAETEEKAEATTAPATEEGSGEEITLKVASVNNSSMIIMEELSPKFTEETGIKVEFTILSENEIRSKITQDVGLGGGEYDLITLGTSDAGTYLDNGWTVSLDPLFAAMSEEERTAYYLEDVFPSVISSMSSATKGLGALPFYSESTMICYNKDIFAAKGLTMPESPTWEEIYELAAACDSPEVSGIAIRGLAGYGENQYIFGSMMNAFGGQYYDKDWNTTYDSQEVRNAWEFYKKLMTVAEDSPTTCGYTECLNLFAQGKAAIYYDATVSAGTFASADSAVAGKVGYAKAPKAAVDKGSTIGGWGIAITAGSKNPDAAFKFLTWATSRDYVKLVGTEKGWTNAPSGTRSTTYETPEYLQACDFAEMTMNAILSADFNLPAANETPYTGTSLPNLPEYSSWGETIAAELANYISDVKDLDACIKTCVDAIDEAAEEGGYR